ncbi:MAG: hydroxyethylthiazole kinase, partial [Firmicutes bacterium]|nr:hydroxyethylthiazole kinase [Bacillota bacterium]
ISAKTAENCGIPSIIDAVGVTCSKLRLDYINALLADTHVSAIKGNIAEIRALLGKHTDTVGIDVKKSERNVAEDTEDAKTLAKKYNCVVMASGKTDIITDGKKTALVSNGKPEMSLVTGTGCVLNVLAATYMSQTDAFVGCVSAAVIFGICGELAEYKNGMASYRINMLDKLYTLTDEEIREKIKFSGGV